MNPRAIEGEIKEVGIAWISRQTDRPYRWDRPTATTLASRRKTPGSLGKKRRAKKKDERRDMPATRTAGLRPRLIV